jgi:hypothetical protein
MQFRTTQVYILICTVLNGIKLHGPQGQILLYRTFILE